MSKASVQKTITLCIIAVVGLLACTGCFCFGTGLEEARNAALKADDGPFVYMPPEPSEEAKPSAPALPAEDIVFYSEGKALALFEATLDDVQKSLPQGVLNAPDGLENPDTTDVISWDTDAAQLQFNFMDKQWTLSYLWSDEDIETARGIHIGSTEDDVISAYGEGRITAWKDDEYGETSTRTYDYELPDLPPAYLDFWIGINGEVEAISAGLVDDTVGA